ncbi:uncharacterized protein LOC114971633 isoform X2 [Acropora millepora]|uniref:uncharacterized protein LOC114971633 isoform X2 n=1 Tax=Acropora millepora TaxID=45264 RepID=UPI001CF57715|nr:uncharacterized protein LOC114971633 isoform X2 [Acropora millepora]
MANSCMLFSTSQSRSQSPRSSWSAPTNERLQVHCVWLKKTIALPEFVPLASSSAATIPLEPTTIEDKRPMTIDVSCLTRGKTLLCRNILTSALSTFLTIVLFGVWEEEGISTARFRFSPEEKPKPKTPVYRSAAHETTKSQVNVQFNV